MVMVEDQDGLGSLFLEFSFACPETSFPWEGLFSILIGLLGFFVVSSKPPKFLIEKAERVSFSDLHTVHMLNLYYVQHYLEPFGKG
jgi:hypothetical protein